MVNDSRSFAALTTPAGRAAIATIVAVSENVASKLEPLFHSASGLSLSEIPINQIAFGIWCNDNNSTGEELVVCRFSSDTIEIHCHGGHAASSAILQDLSKCGFEILSADQYLEQQSIGNIRAEALAAASKATTELAAAHLLAQYHGALENALHELRKTINDTDSTESLLVVDSLLRSYALAKRLTTPTRIVIAGPPNVGKSSLINCIAGYERAIVFDQPGTTRDVINIATAIDGFPVDLSDTAGIRTSQDELESEGIDRARQQIQIADIVLFVFDIRAEFDEAWYREHQLLLHDEQQQILVFNKSDLVSGSQAQTNGILISAKTGSGIDQLFNAISKLINPDDLTVGCPLPFLPRHENVLQQIRRHLVADQKAEAIELIDTSTKR